MRVLFDHQIFVAQSFGGISRYFTQLIQSLDQGGDVQPILPFHYASNNYLLNAPKPWKKWGIPVKFHFPSRGRIERIIEKWLTVSPTRRSLSAGDYDVFHPTYFDPYFLPLLQTKPYVLTVYDIISEKFGHNPRSDPQVLWKPLVIPGAARIIAISHSTKRDVISHFGVPPEKIDVVHLGGGMEAVIDKPFDVPKKFILYVGARTPYKNFNRFVQGVAPLLSLELKVYCAGGGGFTRDELALLGELGIADKVIQSQVSDAQLAFLYRSAAVFVFPSLYEGFGIPVLEAMSCRCPTVISNISSLPEVGGQAVVYFDPTEPESIRCSVARVLNDEALQRDLAQRGSLRAREFTWEQCAAKTAAVYTSVLCREPA